MKTLLIPTDFSESSVNAIHYALEMNRKLCAKVILFHVYPAPVFASDLPFAPPENEELRKDSIAELNNVKKRFESLYDDQQFPIEIAVEGGTAEDEIST